MQIIERTPFSVRTNVGTYKSKEYAPEIVIIPILNMGAPRFFDEIRNRIHEHDIIVVNGTKSKLQKPYAFALDQFEKNKKANLVRASRLLRSIPNNQKILIDLSSESIEMFWKSFLLHYKFIFRLGWPLIGIYLRFFGKPDRFFKRAGLKIRGAEDAHLIYRGKGDELFSKIEAERSDIFMRGINKLLEDNKSRDVRIIVLFNAQHLKHLYQHIVRKRNYSLTNSEWMTIAG